MQETCICAGRRRAAPMHAGNLAAYGRRLGRVKVGTGAGRDFQCGFLGGEKGGDGLDSCGDAVPGRT